MFCQRIKRKTILQIYSIREYIFSKSGVFVYFKVFLINYLGFVLIFSWCFSVGEFFLILYNLFCSVILFMLFYVFLRVCLFF